MHKEVVKRDGRVVEYDRGRITDAIKKAQASANEAGISVLRDPGELAMLVEGRLMAAQEELTIEKIQDAVVATLMVEKEYAVAERYIRYRDQRTRQREIKSDLMKSLEMITFSKHSDIKRENANIDGNTAMGTMLQYGSAVSKEFTKHFLLDPRSTRLHDDGAIHIHDLDFYAMGTLTCCQIDAGRLFNGGFSTGHGALREPMGIESYAALAAIAIQSNQNDQHGGQSLPMFDYDLAEGVRKTFRKEFAEHLKTICEIRGEPVDESLRIEIDEIEKAVKGNALVDFALKKALEKTRRKTYQAMEGLIHNLNTMHSRAGAQVPFSSLNFGTDTSVAGRMVTENLLLAHEAGLGNGETPIFPILIFKVKEGVNALPQDPNFDLFKLALRVSAKRLFPNFSFLDAPFNRQFLVEGKPQTEVAYMGCRTRVIGNRCGEAQVAGRGNLSFTTINLVRIGLNHGTLRHESWDETGFFAELEQRLEEVLDQLLQRMAYQAGKKVDNFPFLMGQGIWQGSEKLEKGDSIGPVLNQGTLSIGFIGLAECLKTLIGKHHGESEKAQELGLRIVSTMHAFCERKSDQHRLNITLLATPAEGLSGRFTRIDRKLYGEIEGVTDRDYYTNAFHVPVYHPISIADKIAIEAPYHAITPAGHITYVEIDGDPLKNLDAMEDIVQLMRKSGIGYGSINHPIDRDAVCGYQGVIEGETCPKCGRNENDGEAFQRIRRITGYLVGTLDRFNNAKRKEVEDRVKHR